MIEISIPGQPIPFMRPRFSGSRGYNDPRYATWKKIMVARIHASGCKALPDGQEARLSANFYRSDKRKVDIDNLLKALMDAIQDAGLVTNDALIAEVSAYRHHDKQNPRIEFMLDVLEGLPNAYPYH